MIQEQLGHASIMLTMDTYGHLYPTERGKVADTLEAAFARGAKPAPKAEVRQIR